MSDEHGRPASWADDPAETVTLEVSVVGKVPHAIYGIITWLPTTQTPCVLKQGHPTCSGKAIPFKSGSWYGPVV